MRHLRRNNYDLKNRQIELIITELEKNELPSAVSFIEINEDQNPSPAPLPIDEDDNNNTPSPPPAPLAIDDNNNTPSPPTAPLTIVDDEEKGKKSLKNYLRKIKNHLYPCYTQTYGAFSKKKQSSSKNRNKKRIVKTLKKRWSNKRKIDCENGTGKK